MSARLGYKFCKSRLFRSYRVGTDEHVSRMELTRQAGNDPPLVGLMRVYKDYYPDVIVGEVTSGRASVFTVCIFF
jgi:hypothetical protein